MIIIVGYSRHPGGEKEINDINAYLTDNNYNYQKKIFNYEIMFIIKK